MQASRQTVAALDERLSAGLFQGSFAGSPKWFRPAGCRTPSAVALRGASRSVLPLRPPWLRHDLRQRRSTGRAAPTHFGGPLQLAGVTLSPTGDPSPAKVAPTAEIGSPSK